MGRVTRLCAAALVTAAVSVLAFRPEPVAASFPGANGKLAFASNRDGNYEIYAMEPDASDQTRLTNDPAVDIAPAWSPDGRSLAFTSERDGNPEIYAMAADGSDVRRLTTDPAADSTPKWSADGKQIAFTSARAGDEDVFVMAADSGDPRRLTQAPGLDRSPAWSPSGGQIAFESGRDGNVEIYVMSADGGGQTRLTRSAASDVSPTWSPDGKRIAFASDRDGNFELYAMDADGSNQRRLTRNVAADLDPTWSPDGSQIAFTSRRDGNTEIYVMNADGSAQTRLTTNETEDTTADWQSVALPPPVVTGALFHAVWRESTLRGAVVVEGQVATPVAVRLALTQGGRVRASWRLELDAGPFAQALALPTTLLPGGYLLQVTPEASPGAYPPQTIPLELEAPREGVVRVAYASASPGGIPLRRFPFGTTVVFAQFRFAALPRPGAVLSVSWSRPGGRLAGPPRRKRAADLVVAFVRSRGNAPLPRGPWKCVIRAGPTVVKRLAFRIR
jgi:Tol biopolymer transport system component